MRQVEQLPRIMSLFLKLVVIKDTCKGWYGYRG